MSDTPDLPDPPEQMPPSLGEAIAADAVVAQAAEHAGHAGPLHPHCENCGTKLEGPYCHRCGQHDFDVHRSFGHVFMEVLESFFHFDAKLFRDMFVLLLRPGRLTAAFNAGKRAAQMPPFRLYVFISILFFFLTFVGNKQSQALIQETPGRQATEHVSERPPSFDAGQTREAMDQLREVVRGEGEKAASSTNPKAAPPRHAKEPGFFAGLQDRLDHLNTPEAKQHLVHSFMVAMPKLILFCLPFFALYTRVLFRKAGQVYLQHLVVAVHFHTFIFLWSMVTNGWGFLLGFAAPGLAGLVDFIGFLWLVAYPFLMLKHLFANSWPRTIVKTGLLGFAYLTTLGIGFAATAAIVLAMA